MDQLKNERWNITPDLFTKEECERIINMFKGEVDVAWVGEQDNSRLDTKVRDSRIQWLDANEETSWIYSKIISALNSSNQMFYNFNIHKLETIQFSEYDESYSGFYDKHVDTMVEATPNGFRKLSFSVQLSDPEEYEGGELKLYFSHEPNIGSTEQGTMNVFPSFVLHEVSPVTKGTRYALVGWVGGPPFK